MDIFICFGDYPAGAQLPNQLLNSIRVQTLPDAEPQQRNALIFALLAVPLAATSLTAFQRWDLVAVSLGLGLIMLAIAIRDARDFIIPDALSLPAIPLGLIASGYLSHHNIAWHTVLLHFAAMAVAGGSLFLIRISYHKLRGFHGLGLGDVKLAAAGGAWTGLQGISVFLLIACIGAIVLILAMKLYDQSKISSHTPVPFGTFLAPAIWLTWVLSQLHGL